MALIQSLRQQANFTAIEGAIADYILEHPEEFSQLSITGLAKATCSSKSAITRLCKKLGQDGYKNFLPERLGLPLKQVYCMMK